MYYLFAFISLVKFFNKKGVRMNVYLTGANVVANYIQELNSRSNPPKELKVAVRVAIEVLQLNNYHPLNKSLTENIVQISAAKLPKTFFIIKIIQYLAYYITFGRYESDYIASKKLKATASQFIIDHTDDDFLIELAFDSLSIGNCTHAKLFADRIVDAKKKGDLLSRISEEYSLFLSCAL